MKFSQNIPAGKKEDNSFQSFEAVSIHLMMVSSFLKQAAEESVQIPSPLRGRAKVPEDMTSLTVVTGMFIEKKRRYTQYKPIRNLAFYPCLLPKSLLTFSDYSRIFVDCD